MTQAAASYRTASDRNAGLDLVRVIAITGVVWYHMNMESMLAQQMGYLGVDLFFVLSGFLIARVAFEQFNGIATPADLKAFWISRWLRILPLYFVFLGLFAVLTKAGAFNGALGTLPRPVDLLSFATFTQNIVTGGLVTNGGWFGVSWSLAVEEWFYLLFPLVLLATPPRARLRVLGLCLAVTLALALGGRLVRYLGDPMLDMEDMFRRPVLFRLDTFVFGVIGYVALFRSRLNLAAHARPLLLLGFVLVALSVALCVAAATQDFHSRVTYLTLSPVGFALMLPAFWSLDVRSSMMRRGLAFISTRTYALYLCHVPVILMIETWSTRSLLADLAIVVSALAFADVVYRYIERPILRRRARLGASQTRCEPAAKMSAV